MSDHSIARRSPLIGAALPNRIGVVTVTDAGHRARFVWRGDTSAASRAFGADLPTAPMRAIRGEAERVALWLGPDEWLLLAPDHAHEELVTALAAAAASTPSSLVDVSHRQVALLVDGPRAALLLAAGCPLDLDIAAFPVDMCTRTLLAKAEIVLWRSGRDTFHVEVQRSFAPYVATFLTEASIGPFPR